MFSLEGKTAIVTGGGSGIGQAISELFAKQRAHVFIFDVSETAAEETAARIRDAGGNVSVVQCDVSRADSVERAFAVALKEGKVDILVNNAGVAHVGPLLKTSEEDLDRLYQINVKGVYLCSRAALTHMVESGGGVITNMASIASLIGVADRFAYSMSKGAVLTMTYSIALDYMDKNIRCNCICPTRIHTPFVDGFIAKNYPGQETEIFQELSRYQPLGRMGKPEEVAAMTLYLSSEEASFITGRAFPLDGGVLVK